MSDNTIEMPAGQREKLEAAMAASERGEAMSVATALRSANTTQTDDKQLANERLEDWLRDRIAPGETLVTRARTIGDEIGRSSNSVANALTALRARDPDGLTIGFAAGHRSGQWTIERATDGTEDGQ